MCPYALLASRRLSEQPLLDPAYIEVELSSIVEEWASLHLS